MKSDSLKNNALIIMRIVSLLFIPLVVLFPLIAPLHADTAKVPRLEIVPAEGPVGTNVFVRVWDYTPQKTVIFIFTANTTFTYSATSDLTGFAVLSLKIDQMPGGRYLVSADDGTNVKTGYFKVTPLAVLSQAGGYVGDIVSVQGTGFAMSKPINIFFDEVKITTSDTDGLGSFANARFSVPPTTFGKHTVKVQDSEGSSSTLIFNVNQKIFVNPVNVAVNDSVAITGTGFAASTSMTLFFNDKENTVLQSDRYGAFNTTFKVPACGDGPHKIKISDGVNIAFSEIIVAPTLTISKDTGFINMQVNLTGFGFHAGNALSAMYDSTKINGSTVDENGNVNLAVNIPKSKAGAHVIMVNDGVNTRKVAFTVESTPPPVPNLITPAEGARITKDVNFQWDAVNDPSGVSYTIQICDDARFSRPLLTEANILVTSYVIRDEQKLLLSRSEPFFWRIKAVDNASNESGWTVTGTFYKGYTMGSVIADMPGWTKFALIALGLILFVFLVLFIWKNIKRISAMKYEEKEAEYYGDNDYEANWEESKN
jgi:hypothetical protein